jgi:hypothetical protein
MLSETFRQSSKAIDKNSFSSCWCWHHIEWEMAKEAKWILRDFSLCMKIYEEEISFFRKTKCILSFFYVSETTKFFSVPFLPLLRVKNSLWVLFNKIKWIFGCWWNIKDLINYFKSLNINNEPKFSSKRFYINWLSSLIMTLIINRD